MVTLMMSWRLNKSSSKLERKKERRKRSWDNDEKIKWNYFIDSLSRFFPQEILGDLLSLSIIISCYWNSFFSPLTAHSASTTCNPTYFSVVFFIWGITKWKHFIFSWHFHCCYSQRIFPDGSTVPSSRSPRCVTCRWFGFGLLYCGEQVNTIWLTGDFNQDVYTKHSFTGCLSEFWWIF